MDLVKQAQQNIEELDKRFFFILENFIENYMGFLKTPQNTMYANEITHVNSVVTNIEKSAFTLKNKMDVEMVSNQKELDQMNREVEVLKKENIRLKNRASSLHKDALTSEGLFENELEWYLAQLKMIVIILIGIVIGLKVFADMKLNLKQTIFSIAIVLIFGSIIQAIIHKVQG